MATTTFEEARSIILQVLNKEPEKFLIGMHFIVIKGEEWKIVKNNLRGGIIVWAMNSSFDFYWDKDSKKWF